MLHLQLCEQLQQLPISSDVANMDALIWALRSLSSTTTTITDRKAADTTSTSSSSGTHIDTSLPLMATYVPITIRSGDGSGSGGGSERGDKCPCAVLQEVHQPGEALFPHTPHTPRTHSATPAPTPTLTPTAGLTAGLTAGITLPAMLHALLVRLIEGHHQHTVRQQAVRQQAAVLPSAMDTSSTAPRGSLTITGTSGHQLDMFRRLSGSWQQASLVGQCLQQLCNSFPSPAESLADMGLSGSGVHSEDLEDNAEDGNASSEDTHYGDVSALCQVVLALSGGICNVGVVLSRPEAQAETFGAGARNGRDPGVDSYMGKVCCGNELRSVTISHEQLSSTCVPLVLPCPVSQSASEDSPGVSRSDAPSPSSSQQCSVSFQPSILRALTARGERGGTRKSHDTIEVEGGSADCYVLCVPLGDNTTTHGYAIVEYADKPDATLVPVIQSLSLTLIRKWQYRIFVSATARLQREAVHSQEKVLNQEQETQVLAGSLSSYKDQWQAFHDFEAKLSKSSLKFSRVTALTTKDIDDFNSDDDENKYGDSDSDDDNNMHVDEISRNAKDGFDVNRDWLGLWAKGATPHTQHLYSGRSENPTHSSLSLLSSSTATVPQATGATAAATAGSISDNTTATVIITHLQQTMAAMSPVVLSLLGGVSEVKNVAAVFIDRHTLGAMHESHPR